MGHTASVKKDPLMNIPKPEKYVLASGAPRHYAWTVHVQMCFGKALRCAAVCTPSLRSRDIDYEYPA